MGATTNGVVDFSLLDELFVRHQGQAGALIAILQEAQSIYGYLPVEVMQQIADRLGMSLGKVYSVATFYAQFYLERRGRHVLKLCDGTACHVKGTPLLATAVEENMHVKPGETSSDGELTVEIVYCLGSCALAPIAVLDDQVMGRLRPDALLRRMKRHFKAAAQSAEA